MNAENKDLRVLLDNQDLLDLQDRAASQATGERLDPRVSVENQGCPVLLDPRVSADHPESRDPRDRLDYQAAQVSWFSIASPTSVSGYVNSGQFSLVNIPFNKQRKIQKQMYLLCWCWNSEVFFVPGKLNVINVMEQFSNGCCTTGTTVQFSCGKVRLKYNSPEIVQLH